MARRKIACLVGEAIMQAQVDAQEPRRRAGANEGNQVT